MQSAPPVAPAVKPGAASLLRTQPGRSLAILGVALLGWGLLAWTALDMDSPVAQLMMPGAPDWSAASVLAIFAMWAAMMGAMMLPSALPVLLTFSKLSLASGAPARLRGFAGAYLLVWVAFSVAATAAQWGLQALGWVDAMIVSRSPALTASLLLVAGAYQFSPLKRVCLAHCRSPMGFLIGEWRPGVRGAFFMGMRHGLLCVGCCWALMALLFVGGVMNLAWIAALALAVALEKLVPRGEAIAALLGLGLIAAGLLKLLPLLSA